MIYSVDNVFQPSHNQGQVLHLYWGHAVYFGRQFVCLYLVEKVNIFTMFAGAKGYITYGLETVVSVLFSNTRTRLLYNEREIFNTARSEAECSIENSEFIVQ